MTMTRCGTRDFESDIQLWTTYTEIVRLKVDVKVNAL